MTRGHGYGSTKSRTTNSGQTSSRFCCGKPASKNSTLLAQSTANVVFSPPPGTTEVLLVRHGESRAATAESPFPLVDGHGDPDCIPTAKAGAACRRRLGNERIATIYVTNLRRTVETAARYATTSASRSSEPDLREVYLGAWEAKCCASKHTTTTRLPTYGRGNVGTSFRMPNPGRSQHAHCPRVGATLAAATRTNSSWPSYMAA